MHVQTTCSGNDSDIVIPSLPCSDSQPADSPHFLMGGLGTKHRVWFQRFGTQFTGADSMLFQLKFRGDLLTLALPSNPIYWLSIPLFNLPQFLTCDILHNLTNPIIKTYFLAF